jgi:hypothetical protein
MQAGERYVPRVCTPDKGAQTGVQTGSAHCQPG